MRALPTQQVITFSLLILSIQVWGDCYAEHVGCAIENWLKRNNDQLLAASVELLKRSEFELIWQIKVYWLKFLPFLTSLSAKSCLVLQKDVNSEVSMITRKLWWKQFSDSLWCNSSLCGNTHYSHLVGILQISQFISFGCIGFCHFQSVKWLFVPLA